MTGRVAPIRPGQGRGSPFRLERLLFVRDAWRATGTDRADGTSPATYHQGRHRRGSGAPGGRVGADAQEVLRRPSRPGQQFVGGGVPEPDDALGR
jgi:hypothetical protein